MKLVFPDYIELLPDDITRLQSLAEIVLYDDVPSSEAEVIRRIEGADIIIPSVVDITETVIKQSSSLRYIVVPGIGYDQIAVKAATAAGIKVLNCPTHNVAAVAEYTIALIFAVTRKIVEAHLALRNGNWNPWQFQGTELKGKTLGLIGYGNTGKGVEKLAIALGMQVIHAASKSSPDELDQLISTVDILSLHLPSTPQSRHLLDERRLGLMKPTAYLINTARGAIVDSNALLNALQTKQIAGAALDVFENEPIAGSPSGIILELAKLDNAIATPHIAYNSYETMQRLGTELFDNVQSCINGNPINVVQ